jgi:hypothetical protein
MTDEQRKALKAVSQAVVSNFKTMTESQAIGRIQQITLRPYDKAIEGLKIMRSENMLPTGWIDPKTDGALTRMIKNNQNLKNLLEKFDCIIGKSEVPEFQGFAPPRKVSRVDLEKRFSLPEF